MMRLINDQAGKWRQDRECRIIVGLAAQRKVCQQQRVIDHQDVGPGSLPPGLMKEAAAEMRALAATALVGFAADLFPDHFVWQEGEVLTGAVAGLLGPLAQGVQLADMFAVKQSRLGGGAVKPALAEVVRSTLDQDHLEVQAGGPLQEGQVFADQLFLEIDRVGRNDQSFTIGQRPEDRRDQVGEAFAGSGPRFDQGDAMMVEGLGHGERHAQLLGSIFEAGQILADQTARAEQFGNLLVLDRGGLNRLENLNHPVELLDPVVDNIKADRQRAEAACDCKVRFGRFEMTAWVVVDNDIAWATGLQDGRNGIPVAAGEHLQVDNNLVVIGVADAEDLIAAGVLNLLAKLFLHGL